MVLRLDRFVKAGPWAGDRVTPVGGPRSTANLPTRQLV